MTANRSYESMRETARCEVRYHTRDMARCVTMFAWSPALLFFSSRAGSVLQRSFSGENDGHPLGRLFFAASVG